MGPEEKEKKKKGFAEWFNESFGEAMRKEHEENESLPKIHKPSEGEGVVDVVEPNGEKHFEI